MPREFRHMDKYALRAQKQGKRARSFFKLEEIDKSYRFLRKGMHVLDLGAAPGSFMQYTRKVVGIDGYILGIDLQKIDPVGENVELYQGDIFTEETKAYVAEYHPEKFDAIVSDLAPSTSGVKDVDHWKSVELSEEVLQYCKAFLRHNGACLIKIFQGEDFDFFLRNMKRLFRDVKVVKPPAVRDRSREVYLLGMGWKKGL